MVSEACESREASSVQELTGAVVSAVCGTRLRSRVEAEEVDWGEIMLVPTEYIEQFGLSPKANGKALTYFKPWSNEVIFALNLLA